MEYEHKVDRRLPGLPKPEARSPKAEARRSVDVAVAAGLFAGVGGAMEVGEDGLEITNE